VNCLSQPGSARLAAPAFGIDAGNKPAAGCAFRRLLVTHWSYLAAQNHRGGPWPRDPDPPRWVPCRRRAYSRRWPW